MGNERNRIIFGELISARYPDLTIRSGDGRDSNISAKADAYQDAVDMLRDKEPGGSVLVEAMVEPGLPNKVAWIRKPTS